MTMFDAILPPALSKSTPRPYNGITAGKPRNRAFWITLGWAEKMMYEFSIL